MKKYKVVVGYSGEGTNAVFEVEANSAQDAAESYSWQRQMKASLIGKGYKEEHADSEVEMCFPVCAFEASAEHAVLSVALS